MISFTTKNVKKRRISGK
jgi:hypothetical protein